MPRIYANMSVPRELEDDLKQVANEEGMENSFSGFLGNTVRAMLILRERNYREYLYLMRQGNTAGWEGWERLRKRGQQIEEEDIDTSGGDSDSGGDVS